MKRGVAVPEALQPRALYQAVLDMQASLPNPPTNYFPYPIYAMAHNNIATVFENVRARARLQRR